MRLFLVSLTCLIIGVVGAIPRPNKTRVKDEALSDKKHFDANDHNADYDHEAFLGEEAKTFDQLTPEESKERLGKIVDKIDRDANNLISKEELKSWIQYTQRRYITEDVDRQWNSHNPEGKETIKWEDYKKMVYGFMDGLEPSELESNSDEGFSYKDMIRRDERRWGIADTNGDHALNKEEFTNFLHPEDAPHMRDIVVVETMEDIDKDKNGFISLEEYIGDMYRGVKGEDEPDWVRNEREQFENFRDKNKDGHMDRDEVKQWIIPPDFDHAEAEAKHLVQESDSDDDGQLTKDEIMAKYDLFVGSQATDFGEALNRHDEF